MLGSSTSQDNDGLAAVRVTWTEEHTYEAVRELDTARIRRAGYNPAHPAEIRAYLETPAAPGSHDGYDWHRDYAEADNRRLIGTDHPVIATVTIDLHRAR
jgi:hypothetical protein